MQITVKSTKVGKTGTSDKGDWELIVVKSEDGTDYTTFHKSAKNLAPGTVIEIGEPTIKNGKCGFKEFTVIYAVAPALQPNGGGEAMTNEMWATKQKVERDSIEAQVAFKGMIDLIVAGLVDIPEPIGTRVMGWAEARLGHVFRATGNAGEVKQSEADKEFEALGSAGFKDLGTFLTRATKKLKLGRSDICVKLSINNVEEITNYQKAWETLTGETPGKTEPKAKEDRPVTPEDIPFD